MAAIDKIYLNKKDVPAFYEYLNKIDSDFKKYFVNAGSILDYTYQRSADNLDDWTNDVIPVSNFPEMVDRWLAQREDLPDIIRKQLEYQYSGGCSIFEEPVYEECKGELSHKFRVRQWTKCEGRRWTKPMTFWSAEPYTEDVLSYSWIPELNTFVDTRYSKPEHVGFMKVFGGSTIRFKSIKAIFRWLRKHGFPKGTKVRITDWRYEISRIAVEFV